MTTPLFNRVAFIGIGLIGSSLARVLKRDGLAGEIVCATRTEATAKTALDLGIVDAAGTNAAEAARDADLVVLCAPVGATAAIAEAIGPNLKAGAVVTDVGSVKEPVIAAIRPHLPEGVHLVPGHPIAGTEHSGPQAGFAELFQNHWCILTPEPGTDSDAVAKVTKMWQAAGMTVECMDAHHHDRVLAITSHLPHLIAFAIVGTANDMEDDTKREVIKFCAGGFRDFTRIAASDPVMWRDIFTTNKDAVLDILGRFNDDLAQLQEAIKSDDGKTLEDWFSNAREIRRGVIELRQDFIDKKPNGD